MKNSKAFASIVAILIICAVTLIIATVAFRATIGEGQAALAQTKGEETLYLVESCVEETLLKARNNSGYNGGTIVLPEGSCSVSIAKSGDNWDLTVANTAGKFTKTLLVKITRAGSIIVNSWNES